MFILTCLNLSTLSKDSLVLCNYFPAFCLRDVKILISLIIFLSTNHLNGGQNKSCFFLATVFCLLMLPVSTTAKRGLWKKKILVEALVDATEREN